MMHVLIIEDEIIIARYIQQLLQKHFKWETRIAVDPMEMELEMKEFRPQLVLCDINLQAESDGIDLIRRYQEEFEFETIYLTSYQSQSIMAKAATTRPANFIIKPLEEKQFLATLTMTEARLPSLPDPNKSPSMVEQLLTRSELGVLQLIARNLSTREIADSLHISPSTVKNHRHNICRKLGLPPENNSILRWTMENRDSL